MAFSTRAAYLAACPTCLPACLPARPPARPPACLPALLAASLLQGPRRCTCHSLAPAPAGPLVAEDVAGACVKVPCQAARTQHAPAAVLTAASHPTVTNSAAAAGAQSVGGSLRAREARRLFQSAAERLQQWAPMVAACKQLYRGGTVRVWNELYASRSPPAPVDRRDARWREVGLGVRRPRLEDLQRVGAALMHGVLEEPGEGSMVEGM